MASADRIQNVALVIKNQIDSQRPPRAVVLSAFGKATDLLQQMAQDAESMESIDDVMQQIAMSKGMLSEPNMDSGDFQSPGQGNGQGQEGNGDGMGEGQGYGHRT